MKALVTGGNGLLAHALRRVLSARQARARFLSRDELDVTLPEAVRELFHEIRPDVVFHCAAYTAVDQAESEEATAIAVNGVGAAHVAESAREVGALLVFPSTDYVFDGTASTPYPVDHPTGPKSAYGRSKLAGEEAVERAGGRFVIARTSWLYGAGGKNFVDTMIRLSQERSALDIVADQVGRPTWTVHLAEALVELAAGGHEGMFHVAGGGQASWKELAAETFRLRGINTTVGATTTEAFGAPAPRPLYSVLDLSRVEAALGRPMPHWRSGLAQYLGEAYGDPANGESVAADTESPVAPPVMPEA